MKTCNNCGASIFDEAVFCTSCGTPLEEDFEGTTVLDDSLSEQDAGIFKENDLDATGLLTEDDFEATGVLDEDNFNVTGVYKPINKSYTYGVSEETQPVGNVNPAFVNPNFQQNQVQQCVSGNNVQSNQTIVSNGYNANAYSPNYQQAYIEQPTLKSCYKKFWQNYANFSGRARRSEYWFAFLANVLISFINIIPYVGQVLYVIYTLAVFIPKLALIVRRLHDSGKEWYYIFILLIPIAGPIIMLVWLCTDSQIGGNKFGDNPKGIN